MESAEMISPPIFSASASAISDFPTAVGPARKIGETEFTEFTKSKSFIQPLLRNSVNSAKRSVVILLNSSSRQNCREREAGDENRHANPLRRREAEVVMQLGIIAAKVFDKCADDRIAEQVSRKNLAVKFFAPEQPCQKKIKNQIQKPVVNFSRMQRHIERCSRKFVRLRIGESDCPRQIRRSSIATTIEQAASAAKKTAQRIARREHVGGFPQRHFFPADVNESGNGRADETAVINESAMLNHENFRERLVGEFFLPIRGHINDSRADDRADHEPEHDVGDFIGGNFVAARAQSRRPKSGEKSERDHDAIPVNREGAEMKRNWMHNLN